MKRVPVLIKVLALAILWAVSTSLQVIAAGTGTLKGLVKDGATGETLPGANVIIVGTSLGAASNSKGEYTIQRLTPGTYTVKARYIGYKALDVQVVISANTVTSQDFNLSFATLESEEVVITAQAEGQLEAINQQLSSNSIKNVVSSARIQELPDANAAESLGRLPGVSILRSGGEGNKVVVRGLSPKYNAITINGVRMAATGSGDRSNDLSMISPLMLEGIEVSKAVTSDQDADVLGGSVNFKIRRAKEGLQFQSLAQGIHNGLRSSYSDYKTMFGVNDRFFNNKLGIFAQFDVEKRNRSSHELGASYAMPDVVILRQVELTNLKLLDIDRDIQRRGGALVIDYKLNKGSLALTNFGSKIQKTIYQHIENHNARDNVHGYSAQNNKSDLIVVTNSLEFDYDFDFFRFDAVAANSYSKNDAPRNLNFGFEEGGAYSNIDLLDHPSETPGKAINDLSATFITPINLNSRFNKERESSFSANVEFDLKMSNNITSKVKFGGKLKYKKREYDFNQNYLPLNWGGRQAERDLLLDVYPEMLAYFQKGDLNIPIGAFLDNAYATDNFLEGNYTLNSAIDFDLMNDVYNTLDSQDVMWTNFPNSLKDDYNGKENYAAAYVQAEINVGQKITLIPGIRFERNNTEYSANRGNSTIYLAQNGYAYTDTTSTRENDYLLPGFHMKYRPMNWLNFQFAYTNTLTRPSYNQITPKWDISNTVVTYNNHTLAPSQSTNIDFNISAYGNTIGLFSIGGFKKSIKDLIFHTGRRANLTPDAFGLPSYTSQLSITTNINNKYKVDIWGLETEWQTHLWYLPGALNGIVLNLNYTHIFSEAQYPRTIINSVFNPNGPPFSITENIDTTYVARLINQPDDIVNLSFGYDLKDFSARVSFIYQSNIFKQSNKEPELRGSTEDYSRWDIALSQKLPYKGLSVFYNLNNLTNTFDRSIIAGPSFPTKEEHYGMTMDFGIRYRFN